jgi:hypothetical protein
MCSACSIIYSNTGDAEAFINKLSSIKDMTCNTQKNRLGKQETQTLIISMKLLLS